MNIGLSSGATGPGVARLHRVLEAAGLVVGERERERQEFGTSTLAALLVFQRRRGLPARGEIDEETYAALILVEQDITGAAREPEPPRPPQSDDRGTAQITLVDGDGAPLPRVRVSLFAQAVRGERELGDATTGTDGECVIAYQRPQALNLMARAYDETLKVIAQSGTYFAAPPQVRIRITTAADGMVRTPSMYTTLAAAVSGELQDVPLTSLRQAGQTQELTFLANAVAAEFTEVAYLYIARLLAAKHKVRDQTFFGIFQAGVPASLRTALASLPDAGIDDAFTAQALSGVLAQSRSTLEAALTAAVTSSVLPASYSVARAAELTLLDGLRAKSAAGTPYLSGQTPLGDLLAAGGITQAARDAFTTALADNNGQLDPTWKALQAGSTLSAADLTALDNTLTAGELLDGNVPLVKDMLGRLSAGSLATMQHLALLDEDEWADRITSVDPTGASLPPTLPGKSPQDRITRFAKALTGRFTARYPTTAFAGGLSRADASSFARSRVQLVAFLVNHPAFSFERTNIDHFLAANDVRLPDETLADLKTAQRLFRLTPRYETVDALKAAGHQSGQSVYFAGRETFVADMAGVFGSVTEAETVYARAQTAYATALVTYARFNPVFTGPKMTAAGPAQPRPDEVASLPDLQALFGSLDFFQCEECESVYSPAAYLVDLLQYLSWFKASVGTARDALLLRRPDLQHLALDCANTTTTLPYIDLVNEILEAAIAPPAAPPAVIETTGTSAERRALPQHVSQAAYTKTAARRFPLSLPFDLPFAQAQAYTAALGTTRAAVLALFAGQPAKAGPARSIAAARLGVNPDMQDVITGHDTAHQDWDRWGLAEYPVHVLDPVTRAPYTPDPVDWVAALSKVPVLLNRSGLTLRQLYQLLEVTWVTDSSVTLSVGTTTVAGLSVLSPATDDMTFTGLTGDVLERANRFLRLWTACGLPMWELNWALRSGVLDDDFLVFLTDAMTVRDRLGLPFNEVLSFWQPLETRDVTNHLGDEDTIIPATYTEVFRNPAVLAIAGDVFVPITASGTGLSGNPIIAVSPAPPTAEQNAITAALGVSAHDISAILTFTGAANAMSPDTLNTLLRYQRLGSALALDIPSLITWIQLTGGQPFGVAPADTLEFCRRLAVLRRTGLGAADLDYLLRGQSAAPTTLAFTPARVTGVLQAIRDAIAKPPVPAVTPAADAISAIVVTALTAATSTTADVVTPVLLKTGVLPLSPATVDLLITQDSGVDPALFPALTGAISAVAKAAALFHALRPTAAEFAFAVSAAQSYGWLDPSALPDAPVVASPYADFEALLTALRLDRRQPVGNPGLFDVLAQWLPPGSLPADVQAAVEAVAPALNASKDDVRALATALGATKPALVAANRAGSLADMAMLGAIAAALDVAATYRISGAALVQLAAAPATDGSASAARAALQAQYGQDAWLAAIRPVEDTLRETRRDALVAYLLGPGPADARVPAMLTTDDIYIYYLIDPEMSSCALTTRLLEASLAIQQFVQQAFLNLAVDGVTVDTADARWDEWSWRQQFRLWQAARQVFCYPENYLLPELRADASPFFTDLHNDLRQSDFTTAAAEAALQNYLRKLTAVANLTVAAHYAEKRADGTYVLHVFAHTGGTPDQWFYRTRTGATPDYGSWSAWQTLNLDIASQHLVPVIWDRRLYLIWPIFRQISEKQGDQAVPASGGGNTKSPPPRKLWSVELAMSHLSAGQWQPKQTLAQKLYWNTADSPLSFTFRGAQDNAFNLSLGVYMTQVEEAIAMAQDAALKQAQLDLGISGWLGPSVLMPLPFYGSALGSTATVQLDWSGSPVLVPTLSVTASQSVSSLVTGATLPMPESPLAVTELQSLLPGIQSVDLSQEPTYAQIGSGLFFGSLPTPAGYGFAGQNIVAGNYTLVNPGSVPLKVLCAHSSAGATATVELLAGITNPTIVPPAQEEKWNSTGPFFVADTARTYLVQPTFYTISRSPTEITDISSYSGRWATVFTFMTFYHPYARTFLRTLETDGIPRLMSRDLQLHPQRVRGRTPDFDFVKLYGPQSPPVAQPYPGVTDAPDPGETELDFAVADAGAYSLYNWELFYHAPMLIASLLLQNKKFNDALAWLEYVFNPTDSSGDPTPERYWQFAPLNAMSTAQWTSEQIQNLLTTLAADTRQQIPDPVTATAIQHWMDHPYDPHAVASVRIAAYGKATVMQFLDTIIAWGDWYYSQYTAEMVGYAEQLYVLADMLLGPRPQGVRLPGAGHGTLPAPTYASLKDVDLFANALVNVENVVAGPEPSPSAVQATSHVTLPHLPGNGTSLLFCIPPNPKLLGYWDAVARRLYNIRHCLNLQGQPQPLPLYAPPVSPLGLAGDQAAGAGGTAPAQYAPVYRFSVYLQKAVELANDVRGYGALVLSALEKQDAEALAALRAGQELDIQTRMLDVKAEQVTEAQDQITALQNQRAVVQTRYDYYSTIAFMNAWETAAIALQGSALIQNGAAVSLDVTAGIAHLIPVFDLGVSGFGGSPTVKTQFGGANIGEAAAAWASVARGIAGMLSEAGGMAATMGGYQRRQDEWNLQAQLAQAELTQVDSQITAAQDRLKIAQQEQSIAAAQAANARQVSDFLTSKYTNAQLYSWMSSGLTAVYTQAYQLAYAYALQAQNAYNYELGSTDTLIHFGYWDSQHKGLTAGESLLFDLRRLEAAYVAGNAREHELTKHVSLVLTAPTALVQLRETGTCQIELDEVLFEYDHPGQYFRRLRSVALTIPCVTGPYTGVHATLKLAGAWVRTTPADGGYQPQLANDPPNNPAVKKSPAPAAGVQTIATSSGQADAGLFDVNLHDERWLPFEGQGAISKWELTLDPRDNNFDFTTITDVVLHVRYTARGGDDKDAADNVRGKLVPPGPRTILVSARNTFSDSWYAFLHPGALATEQTLSLPLTPSVFPYTNYGNGTAKINKLALYVALSVPAADNTVEPPKDNTIVADMTGVAGPISLKPMAGLTTADDPPNALTASVAYGDPGLAAPQTLALTIPLANVPDALSATVSGRKVLDPAKVEDVLLVVTYSIG